MDDERESKRARQACENCRRKKTRCSGERPACQYCIHLGQDCRYARKITTTIIPSELPTSSASAQFFPISAAQNQPDLATRLAMIESRLGLNPQFSSLPPAGSSIRHPSLIQENEVSSPKKILRPNPRGESSQYLSPPEDDEETSKFSMIPPQQILESLADTYFTTCHNQPYSLFHESSFRQRISDSSFPDYLLMAFVATAARYSSHAYFDDRQTEATETYSKKAWHIILQQVFSSEQGLNLYAVQATNLLAAIDFTAGQHRLGWVKIGLAIRFAQGLRLNVEPDPNIPSWQQEERRGVFWSVYIMDRFVSCCRARAPSILDVDCTVMLPTSDQNMRTGVTAKSPTLAILHKLPDMSVCKTLNDAALLVLVASILGRIVRYSLQQRSTKGFSPWDFRSDFAKISTMLLSFETLLSVADKDLASIIHNSFGSLEGLNRPRVATFVWSRAVYHLSCCLLHHPFLLYRHLQPHKEDFPRSFARASLLRCKEHAEELTTILHVILEMDCCSRGSFLGYSAVVAGSVHKLYENSADASEQARSAQSLKVCLDFLQQGPAARLWRNYPRMAAALREFRLDRLQALSLLDTSFLDGSIEDKDLSSLSCVLDYGWLSNANRTEPPSGQNTPQNTEFENWSLFDDMIGSNADQSFDIVGSCVNTILNTGSRSNEWWFDNPSTNTFNVF